LSGFSGTRLAQEGVGGTFFANSGGGPKSVVIHAGLAFSGSISFFASFGGNTGVVFLQDVLGLAGGTNGGRVTGHAEGSASGTGSSVQEEVGRAGGARVSSRAGSASSRAGNAGSVLKEESGFASSDGLGIRAVSGVGLGASSAMGQGNFTDLSGVVSSGAGSAC
jgi:hypothetical protein